MPGQSKAKRYCFTSFKDVEPNWNPAKMLFLVFQREIAPETKKEHWQGTLGPDRN